MRLFTVGLAVFLINVPFGFWRAQVRKFSKQWLLAVHLPVPIVIGLRIYSGLGFHLATFPAIIGAFFLGQFIGGKLNQRKKARH